MLVTICIDSHHAYVYYCHQYSYFGFFLVETECGLPFYFKHKKFQKVVDYPPFESVIEIGDHPPLVKVLIYIFFGHVHFKRRNSFVHGRNSCCP